MKSRTWLHLVIAVSAGCVYAPAAWSQIVEPGRFDINVGGGFIAHPNSSALVSISPDLNLRGQYFFNENIAFGFAVDYSRTSTDDDIFPLSQFDFGTADSTLFVALRQPVAVFQYQGIVALGTTVGESLYPLVRVGAGAYTIYMDPQQNEGPVRKTDFLLSVGGALKFRVAESSSIELSIQDYIWTSYNRDDLNPTLDRTCRVSGERQFRGTVCPNERFPFLDPERSDPDFSGPESTIHNVVVTASFSFVPRLR